MYLFVESGASTNMTSLITCQVLPFQVVTLEKTLQTFFSFF